MRSELTNEVFLKTAMAVPQGVIVSDHRMHILQVNEAAQRLLGWKGDEMIGKKLCSFVHCHTDCGELVDSRTCAAYRTAVREAASYHGKVNFTHHNGHPLHLDLNYAPLIDNGKVAGVVTTFRNIVKPKPDESEKSGRGALMFNGMPLRILVLEDSDDDVVLLQQQLQHGGLLLEACERVQGEVELLNALAQSEWDVIVADYNIPGFDGMASLKALQSTGLEIPFILVSGVIDEGNAVEALLAGAHDFINKRDLSRLVPAVIRGLHKVRVHRQKQDTEGQLHQYMAELDQATRLLKAQQFALDQHSIVAITDQKGNITYANDKFCEISQYSREELIGQNHRILKSGHHPPEFFKEMWHTIAHGKVWKGEVRNRNKSGDYYWVNTTIVPFLNDKGKPYQYVAIRTDITQRKHDEEELEHARDAALEASRLKSEFLATISHEIRTPMNGVLGMVELLLDSHLDQRQREQAHTILESASALLDIINDILDFSKIEAGRMTVEEEDFVLANVVESIADILAPKARQKTLALMTRIDTAMPDMLRGDAGRLRQVLLNLAGNAIKFTDAGEILVDVSVDAAHDSSTIVRFAVTDSGIGIPHEQAVRLFQPFMQADSSTTRRYGGTGLGLSICKRLVELMGGEIGLESIEGKGSTFWFTLPLKKSASGSRKSLAGTELTGMRVLVVDDSKANRDVLQHYLQDWGADCSLAEGGVEALALLRQAVDIGNPIDLVLTDLAMPDMNGFELAEQIQGDETLAQSRLVMLTASDEAGQGNRAMHRGFKAYFNKPVRRAQLFEGLCRVLKNAEIPLPALESPAAFESVPVDQPSDELVLLSGVKLLLAEDNPVNQIVAMRQLERLGYPVRLAGNGREALELAQQESFALVLMDCQMPEMDGYEATARIREWERQQGLPRVPIIAVTANVGQGDSERCLAAGMDDFLPKPVRIEKLRETLTKWHALPSLHSKQENQPNLTGSVDHKILEKLRSEVGEYVGEIIDSYLNSTPALLENLMRALEARDFDELRMFAHSLKSSSLQLGFTRLGEMARDIEMRVRSGDLTFSNSDFERLFEEFNRVAAGLRGTPQPVLLPKLRVNQNLAQVLVVDDDVTMRLMLRRAMEEEGYQVEEAVNGEQAVSKCEALQPDIVLMDCLMPVMNGFDACAQLQLLPGGKRIPVLMITGLNDDVSVQHSMQAGAADFITKPVYIPILRQRVRQLLEMKRTQEHIHHLAYHDTLTGLPNRVLFNDRLQLAIAAAKRGGHRLAVLFLDLDKFKRVNDSLGHAVGDMLLKSVAERIFTILRGEDTLSRMGGDEFTLLLPQLAQGDEGVRGAQVLADKIIQSLNAPFYLEGQDIYIGTSIGISIYPEDSTDASGLLKNADSAMYWAKAAGRNGFCLYSTTMHEQVTERLRLESDLHKALERDELVVYYQPQMNVVSERMEGMEALLRWHHPELGLVSPDKFIPLAEDSDLIVDIGTWVIRTACAQCKVWHERGYDQLIVAVNLSPRQFRSGNTLVSVVEAALQENGLPPHALDLEITESITMQHDDSVLDMLWQLKGMGVQISMDDFGTGYSSLSYLKRFPIDVLKIDQSFVRDIVSDPNDAAIVETIIAMAKTLGMHVIAEGVETSEQLEFLRDKGCEVVQGYLISRPHPPEEFEDLLK